MKPVLYCSFCEKSQHDVKYLVAGPKAFICDTCTDACWEIVHERTPADLEYLSWIDALRLHEARA